MRLPIPGQATQALRVALVSALAIGCSQAVQPAAHAAASSASTPGSDPTAGISNFSNLPLFPIGTTPGTYGWEFTIASPINVTSLGIWDDLGNGLGASYSIAIWDQATQNLLAQATLPSGTTGTLVNNFRYTSLGSSVALQAGTYRIGAYWGSNTDPVVDKRSGTGTATPGSGISLGSSFSASGGSLAFPSTDTAINPGYFGPNFQFTSGGGGSGAAAAPGPLPALGAAAAWGFSRRLRQRIRTRRPEA